MAPTIRDYVPQDETAVVELSTRAWAPVFESVAAVVGADIDTRLHGDDWRSFQAGHVREVLGRAGVRTWVAEAEGAVVGFVAAAVVDPERRIGELTLLAVEPAAQRRGIGTALTEHGTAWLRDAGMLVAFIGTGGDAGHAPARRLYERASYTRYPSVQYYKAL